MKLSELLYEEDYIFCELNKDTEIEKIETDPQNADENTLLIIPNSSKIKSPQTFTTLPKAVACDRVDIVPSSIPKILLSNARLALSKAFYRFYGIESARFKIIGITGTNGKTSTAYYMKTILKAQGKKVGYIGTGIIEIDEKIISDESYSMTTPDAPKLYKTLKQMDNENCDVVIMEVSSHALALEKVAPLFFDYAVFTNLSSEHSDFHKTMEDYLEAKCKLFKQCKTAVFNLDDSHAKEVMAASSAERSITIGVLNKGDVFATHIENNGSDGISYLYRTDRFMFRMKVNIPGVYNVYNSLLASAVCIDMGCPPCKVKEAIEKLERIPGRFEIIKNDITVIVDFAHTEVAFESFLREAKALAHSSKLWVIFGCGGERDKQKRPRMAAIAEKYADKIILTTDNPRNEPPEKITADIIEGFSKSEFTVIKARQNAIASAILSAETDDVIAIIGKGAEKYIIDDQGFHEYDEMKVVKDALLLRKGAG